MPVFDFNNTPDKDKPLTCTYTTFRSDESTATPERPMLVLDNKKRQWKHHSSGFFSNPAKQTTFDFEEEDGLVSADLLQIDDRFVSPVRTEKMDMPFIRFVRSLSVAAPNFRRRMVFYSL